VGDIDHDHDGNGSVNERTLEGHGVGKTKHKAGDGHKGQHHQVDQTGEGRTHSCRQIGRDIGEQGADEGCQQRDHQGVEKIFKASLINGVLYLLQGEGHISGVGYREGLHGKGQNRKSGHTGNDGAGHKGNDPDTET